MKLWNYRGQPPTKITNNYTFPKLPKVATETSKINSEKQATSGITGGSHPQRSQIMTCFQNHRGHAPKQPRTNQQNTRKISNHWGQPPFKITGGSHPNNQGQTAKQQGKSEITGGSHPQISQIITHFQNYRG